MALMGGGERDGEERDGGERDGGEMREALCLCTRKAECTARVAPVEEQRKDERVREREREMNNLHTDST